MLPRRFVCMPSELHHEAVVISEHASVDDLVTEPVVESD